MNTYELLIQKLDAFIRKYYLNKLLRGVLIFVGLLLGFYLFISVFEYQLYFSSFVRKVLLLAFVGVIGFAFIQLIAFPLIHYFNLGKSITHEQAATIIGKHFADVKDKLLNILQLKQQAQQSNNSLIEASIQQKTEAIKLVPFSNAIQLGENKKYLKYALPPFLILLFLLIAAPNILKESGTRLLNPNTVYAKKAPFEFVLENKKLKVLQYEDLDIKLKIEGKTLPNEVNINENGKQYKMEKIAANEFAYHFSNVQQTFSFYFSAAGFNSNEYQVSVLQKPMLANFSAQLIYPAYTKKKNETLKNTGDMVVPAGTTIQWNFETSAADVLKVITDNTIATAKQNEKNSFTFSKKILNDTRYTVWVSNKLVNKGDSVSYLIAATPDNYPGINVEKIQDSTQKDFAIFLGALSDDYGLSRLEFHYTIKDENGNLITAKKQNLPFNNSNAFADFNFQIDFSKYALKNGEKMDYYFEVFDNDGVNGAKSTKSQVYTFDKPSVNELEKQEFQNNENIKQELSDAAKSVTQLSAQIKEMKEKILNKKSLNWEDKKQLQEIQKEHQKIVEQLENIKNKYDENLKNQDAFKEENEEIKEKQEKLQEMLKDMMSDEMKDLMKQIEDILQKMEQKNTFENLDKMEMSNKNLKSELDKMKDLFKQLQLEQKAQEIIDKLNKLADEQEKLADQTQQKTAPNKELQQQQDALNKKMGDIQEQLQQLEKINEDAKEKLNTKDNKEQGEDIKQEMEKSSNELQQQQNDKASKSQKSSSQKMKNMANKMQNALNQMQMNQNAEDIKMIRQLLENLVKLSFDQEKLMKELKETELESSKYVQIMQRQHDLSEDAQLIGDSLQALGKRQFQLQTFISDEMYKLQREMKKSLDNLEERQKYVATVAQQMVMTSTNNLALMLSESLDNIQQMQRKKQGKPGNGSCKNPGGEGERPSLSEMQKKLGEQLGKMQQGIKEGKNPQQMGKDFANAVQQQAAIREALQQMKEQMNQKQKQGDGNNGNVDDMIKKMDDLEKELAMKKLSNNAIKRQQEIQTRLLEFEKAQREQQEDNQRQSKSAIDIPKKLPPALEQYMQNRKATLEQYKAVPPSLNPFYKNLVEKYLRLVN
ncbi:MAG: DUF4175 domain-containing protein [Bacteroidetes bacterium]|nr:DUF4175 domain-containing protein [Bacteroidota bacterium]